MMAFGCGDDVLPLADAGARDAAPPALDAFSPMDASVDTSDAGPEDVGTDAEAPRSCAEEPCRVEWAAGPDLPRAVDHHTISVLGPPADRYLTVIGGLETTRASVTGMSGDVSVAPILEDGSLGDFVLLGTFMNPISFHAQTMSLDGRAIILGGISQTDGMLAALPNVFSFGLDTSADPPTYNTVRGTDLPSVFRHATAELIGERLYIIAGLSGSGPQDTVLVSNFAEGTNGPWSAVPSLPEVRTHHASLVYEERIYIFGGFGEDDVPREDVLRSVHDTDGELTAWEVVGTWEEPRWTSSGFVHDGHAYLVGGGYGVEALSSVVRAEFRESGIGPFQEVEAPLPRGRAHVHQLPFVDGTFYSAGGRAAPNFSSTPEVHVGRLIPE